ncbi:MAG: hypothetical protein IPG34_15705 [Rhodocyclaceae bacterium]|nr:hypothetical protein [Rhodocyclaceae bacterium]
MQKLDAGRIDLRARRRAIRALHCQQNEGQIKPVLNFKKTRLYLTYNGKSGGGETIAKLNTTLQAMVKDGTTEKSTTKYRVSRSEAMAELSRLTGMKPPLASGTLLWASDYYCGVDARGQFIIPLPSASLSTPNNPVAANTCRAGAKIGKSARWQGTAIRRLDDFQEHYRSERMDLNRCATGEKVMFPDPLAPWSMIPSSLQSQTAAMMPDGEEVNRSANQRVKRQVIARGRIRVKASMSCVSADNLVRSAASALVVSTGIAVGGAQTVCPAQEALKGWKSPFRAVRPAGLARRPAVLLLRLGSVLSLPGCARNLQ